MTDEWNGNSLATALAGENPDAIESCNRTDVWVKGEHILQICFSLRDNPEFGFDLLNSLTAALPIVFAWSSLSDSGVKALF